MTIKLTLTNQLTNLIAESATEVLKVGNDNHQETEKKDDYKIYYIGGAVTLVLIGVAIFDKFVSNILFGKTTDKAEEGDKGNEGKGGKKT